MSTLFELHICLMIWKSA